MHSDSRLFEGAVVVVVVVMVEGPVLCAVRYCAGRKAMAP
jgi:hypothetical protein